jgi:hypothetical protein
MSNKEVRILKYFLARTPNVIFHRRFCKGISGEKKALFLRKAQMDLRYFKKEHIQSVVLFYSIIHYTYTNYINLSLII